MIKYKSLRKKLLVDPEVQKEYEASALEYEVTYALILARVKDKMTQNLEKEDIVKFKIEGNKVMVQKLPYTDYEYLDSLSKSLLFEWLSPEDDEAYHNL